MSTTVTYLVAFAYWRGRGTSTDTGFDRVFKAATGPVLRATVEAWEDAIAKEMNLEIVTILTFQPLDK